MGMIIEKYIGRTGRKLFMLFCWLFTLLVMAAFTDMVAGTFVGKGVEGMTKATGYANSAAASISMLFIVVAIIFGLIQKKVGKMKEWVRAVVAIALLVVMFIIGMKLPMYATKSTWIYIVMAYLFLASVMPMWLLMEPRDYMTTFMLLGMIIGAVVGVIAEHPTMKLNAFSGFNVDGSYLFPTLFVTIACGAVSGFHSLVSSGTSSKTISNEKDMPMVGYGAMVVESLLGVIALVVVGAVAVNGTKPEGTPFSIFSTGVAGFFEKFGIPVQVATVFMTMCVSALALTSLDSVARIGRMSFQELFYGDTTDTSKMPGWQKVLTNKYFATIITLFFGYLLTLGGYNNIWPLFGSANQLLAALVLICTCGILKDNWKNRLDTLHTDVCYAGSYVYRTDPEDHCTGFQYFRWSGNFPGRRSAVYRGYSSDGSRCAGCIQLSEETVYCKEAGSISYLFCFLHSRGETP